MQRHIFEIAFILMQKIMSGLAHRVVQPPKHPIRKFLQYNFQFHQWHIVSYSLWQLLLFIGISISNRGVLGVARLGALTQTTIFCIKDERNFKDVEPLHDD